jgi:hypothetical protein
MRKFSGNCLERDGIFENETAKRDDLKTLGQKILFSSLEGTLAQGADGQQRAVAAVCGVCPLRPQFSLEIVCKLAARERAVVGATRVLPRPCEDGNCGTRHHLLACNRAIWNLHHISVVENFYCVIGDVAISHLSTDSSFAEYHSANLELELELGAVARDDFGNSLQKNERDALSTARRSKTSWNTTWKVNAKILR